MPPKERPVERKSNGPELDLRDSRLKEKKETGPMFHSAAKKMMPEFSDFEKEKKDMERKMKEQMEKMKELEKRELEAKMQRQKMEERKLVDEKRKLAMYNEKKRQDFEKRKEEERRKEIERMRERKKVGDKKELEEMQAKYKEMEREMEKMKSRLNGGGNGSSSSSGKRDVREVEARRFPGEKGFREEVLHSLNVFCSRSDFQRVFLREVEEVEVGRTGLRARARRSTTPSLTTSLMTAMPRLMSAKRFVAYSGEKQPEIICPH